MRSRRSCNWFSMVLVLSLLFGSNVALSQVNALYQGANRNEFIKKWLFLGPVPIAGEKGEVPGEEAQKKAFQPDYQERFPGCGSAGRKGRKDTF
jgi:hypothetical protein